MHEMLKINTSFQECSLFLFDQIIYDNLVLNVVARFVESNLIFLIG